MEIWQCTSIIADIHKEDISDKFNEVKIDLEELEEFSHY